ncbi:VOC family protein [Sporosarcina sp. Te-1]|uniref:VOC family protein n=1 Tax=Sporosarcina sp. Te-1 TaxID=2818390 RepID=UPI001A9ED56A|nr:VOC family protein [Sporosarcina sp. Te-1]QTD42730.1 VOC family protein [Sporosarcina sp. Te-1]
MIDTSNSTLMNGKVVIWHYVKDLPRAIEWYSEILGIQPVDQIDVACFFSINENTKLALSNRFKAKEDNGLPVSSVLDLQSDDIFSVYRLFKSKGVHVEELTNPLLTYHEFYFRDLDQNQIRVHGFVQSKEAPELQSIE